MFDVITAVRMAMSRKPSPLSLDELFARQAAVTEEKQAAEAASDALEAAADQDAVDSLLDEVALARQDKKLQAARDLVRQRAEQLARIELQIDAAERLQIEEGRRSHARKIGDVCQQRAVIAGELDFKLTEVAKLLDAFVAQNNAVHSLLGAPLNDSPPMLFVDALRRRVSIRLLAATPAVWACPGISPWEAAKLPSLKMAAEQERDRILAQLPRLDDGPVAA
jgi:hypothetical protein